MTFAMLKRCRRDGKAELVKRHAQGEDTLAPSWRRAVLPVRPNLMETITIASAAARPTRVRYVVMAFLCVLAFLTYFDRVCIASAQGVIKHDLGITDPQMGLIMGAFWLSYGLFEIPVGWMGDRFGARRTLSRIVLAWSLFTALSGSAVGFLSLLMYRFLFGIGEAGAYPNMARVQSRWFSPQVQARMGGVLWLLSRWGGAVSYLIFPTVLDRPAFRWMLANSRVMHSMAHVQSWRMGFWICGAAGFIWVLLFFPWFRDDPARKGSVNAAELELIRAGRTAPSELGHSAQSGPEIWKLLLTNGSLWAIAFGYLGSSFGWSFFVSWMTQYLRDVQHIAFQDSKWLSTGPLLFGGMACLVGGMLSDWMVRRTGRKRLGRVLFPIVGSSIAAISMCGITLAHTPEQAAALMCLASFGTDLGQAPAWASIIGIGGAYAGTAFGFINMIANTGGNFLGPVIAPQIFHRWGWTPALSVYAAAFLFAACMWLFIDPTRRFYEDDDGWTRSV